MSDFYDPLDDAQHVAYWAGRADAIMEEIEAQEDAAVEHQVRVVEASRSPGASLFDHSSGPDGL